MNAELRTRLRRRTKEIRAALAERQDALRERMESIPAVRRERDRRRRQRLMGLLLILLLLLVVRCDCENPPEPAPPPATQPAPEPPPPPKKPVVKVISNPKPPIRDRSKTQRRATFEPETRPQPSWLDDFRLQVAARGPRLARCFEGSERPGALRWTASVNAGTGAVSDHELERMGLDGALAGEQKDCVVGVLSNPVYRLRGDKAQALPERISIAVEF